MEAELLYECAKMRQLEMQREAQQRAWAAALRRGAARLTPQPLLRDVPHSPSLPTPAMESSVDEPEAVTQAA